MLDTGTTALEVARYLPPDAAITVPPPPSAWRRSCTVPRSPCCCSVDFCARSSPVVFGPLTESMLSSLHIDLLFMGCDGATAADGFYSADLHVSSLEQAMIRIADRVVVVTESHKFGKKSFVRYATPAQIHTIISDAGLTAADRANLQEVGVQVLIAQEE